MINYKLYGLVIIFFLNIFPLLSQDSDYSNPIQTAIPFLDIPTNARIGGFGEIATVSSPFYPDAGLYQNPALLSKNARYAGGNLSFNPWDNKVFNNFKRGEVSAYYAINESNAIAYNFTLFNYGEIVFVDETGNTLGVFKRVDYFHQFTYSHSFKNGISLGGAAKYIRSSLGISHISGIPIKPAHSFAVDLGFNYGKAFKLSEIFTLNLNAGVAINNFGLKIIYTEGPVSDGQFLPTAFRLGILLNPDIKISENFTIGIDLAYQMEKLLVPTPPLYKKDEYGSPIPIPGTDKYEIEKGMDPDVSVFRALHQSFYDAPYGFSEEIHEIVHKLATEVRIGYQQKVYVAGRLGKFIEHESKGEQNYLSWGIGFGAFGFTLDFKKIVADNVFVDDV
jgi:hypothetical protein